METMKRAAITGVRQAVLLDTPIPEPKEDWVLVKVHAVPLCTEYKNWLTGNEYGGHEAAGEVVKVAQPGKVKVGDRVVVMPGWPCGKCALCFAGDYIHCQNWYDHHEFSGLAHGGDTHVQYLLKQDWLLVPIPDGLSYELASLACCGVGPTFGAMENMNVGATDTVLITGGGPVGLGGVVNAKYRNAKAILVEPLPYRQQKAKELGADLRTSTGLNAIEFFRPFQLGVKTFIAVHLTWRSIASSLVLKAILLKAVVLVGIPLVHGGRQGHAAEERCVLVVIHRCKLVANRTGL